MARTVSVKAGKQSAKIFACTLLQNTGERFSQQLLQTPDMHGCADTGRVTMYSETTVHIGNSIVEVEDN